MYDFVLCSFALFFFVLFCCRLPRCMILFLYVVCSVFSSSTVNKFPRKRLLHFFFRVRNLKKRGGKQGRTGGGGGIHALSNGTVLPHYDCNVYVCSCSLFFFSCIAKKASYMAAWLCVKKLSYQIKFFWIELNWSGVRRATVAPRSHSSLRDILCYFCLHCKVMGEVRVTQRRIARGF